MKSIKHIWRTLFFICVLIVLVFLSVSIQETSRSRKKMLAIKNLQNKHTQLVRKYNKLKQGNIPFDAIMSSIQNECKEDSLGIYLFIDNIATGEILVNKDTNLIGKKIQLSNNETFHILKNYVQNNINGGLVSYSWDSEDKLNNNCLSYVSKIDEEIILGAGINYDKNIKTLEQVLVFMGIIAAVIVLAVLFILRSHNKLEKTEKKNIVLFNALSSNLEKLELQVFRSHINSHFIMHAIMRIKDGVRNGKIDEAYIDNFAWLLRYFIESSSKQTVLLKEDLESIKRYMEVMKVIYGNINYKIEIEEQLKYEEIPPLLIHPFIEDAILIAHSEEKSQDPINISIVIEASESANYLICSIIDNGISIEERKQKIKKRTSKGIEVVNERIKRLKKDAPETKIDAINIYEENQVIGAKTTIHIPL